MNFKKVQEVLDQAVAKGEVPGVVGLITDERETLFVGTAGFSEVEGGVPMEEDTLFCIASMTKPITGIAAMMMQEEGKLSLDDSLAKYLPDFAKLRDGEGNPLEVTLRQCLSHTSGMSDLSLEEENECLVLEDLIPHILSKPVNFEPGSKWCYCQTSINMVAHVVELLSGQDFSSFLRERILAPLSMNDTGFYPTEDQLARLSSVYDQCEDGWKRTSHDWVTHGRLERNDRYPKANAGLFSTASDYARFCRSLLNGGQGLISRDSLKEFSSVQTGDLETGFTPGNAWGLGCAITRDPQGVTSALSPGTFGHGGLYGTQAWIDPLKKRAYILMIQRTDFENADGSEIREAFQNEAILAC